MSAEISEKETPPVTIVQPDTLYKTIFEMSNSPNYSPVASTDITKHQRDGSLDVYMQMMDGRKHIKSVASDDDEEEDSSWSSSSEEKRPERNPPGSVVFQYYSPTDKVDNSEFHGKNASQESLLEMQDRRSTSNLLGGARHYEDDDEDDNADRPDAWLNDNLENGRSGKSSKTPIKWTCTGFFVVLIVGWMAWAFVLLIMPQQGEELTSSGNHIEFNDVFNSSFRPSRPSLVWVQNSQQDGVFTYVQPNTGDIILESVEDQVRSTFVKADELQINNKSVTVDNYLISADTEYLMIWTNRTKQFRHSYFSNVYIFDLIERTLTPLNDASNIDEEPQISYAVWSPKGHSVAYVMNNDLYVTDLVKHTRITFDGTATIFNGVPDWVYEEEVFGTNFATWWSPDATHIAYLRFNETEVPEFKLPLYAKSNDSYPQELVIKYPKAGYPNPTVSLHVYSLADDTSVMVNQNSTSVGIAAVDDEVVDFADNDRLITQVVWTTTTHDHLVYKQTNRVQDHEKTITVSLPTTGKTTATAMTSKVSKEYKPEDGGWVEVNQDIKFFGPQDKDDTPKYIDIADNGDGYMHLALYAVNGSNEPVWLTTGDWEVISGTVVVDSVNRLIHYISTEVSPLERHLYMLNISDTDDITKHCITCFEDEEVHGYYSASFSPKAGYYVLNYEGPEVPTTVVNKVGDSNFSKVLENNTALVELLKQYSLPKSRMVTVKSGGVDMNAIEILPPDFDPAQRYPVVFRVYGGPGSQMASYRFQLDWHTFIASKLRYIVVMADGRGTGFRGRKYRVGVRGRLGELETIDQVNAGRHWASLDYVDPTRLAIWGWSYGGFMTSKVVEADDGVFSVGMAVAPVTDWKFYDSIYTERYMLTPQLNADGYQRSAVNNMTGFNHTNYLLVHGTGDDNVHFQNAAALIDRLTMASVHNYRVQFYTDSDHSINTHNANREIYWLLTDYVWEGFGGEEYDHVRRETHGQVIGPVGSH
ncbi:hypothetical protein K450DRAFT_221602 [Umbelopsis ramanniana AG]|uniref:Dipeptidyl aminopeptidase n=1 Tax=Umbelopsis ramanniana AG TaxID=1314678 RepID=A0AAD5HHZ2_UMBRA|nr:uncharacterized protein K450DRAFT_221602 [Umbelopsis ramanniana AG]KAI8583529.1 hypothetical protein K450DRAFT_221602 [Umbelopsis ramanniana AG]